MPRPHRRWPNGERRSCASGGSSAGPWPTAWRRPGTSCSLPPACRQANGNRPGPRMRSSACTRSSSGGSRPKPSCPRRKQPPCWSGRCSPRARSPCARSTAGRRSPRSRPIRRLTSRPEPISSPRWRTRHNQFQHRSRRHLHLSQGGLMNLLRRAQGWFEGGQRSAISALRQAEMVASDETGVRIEGANAYHWVFRSPEAVVHHAAPTRSASVVRDMMDGHRPALWLSDRYSAQQGHGMAHQTCLAHLARDIAYAVEASDDPVPWRLQIWLDAVFALAGRVTSLAASTLAAKRRTLDRHLAGILATASSCDLTRALQAKISRARDQLLTFLDHPGLV